MFLFSYLCKFCRNPQPSFTFPFRNTVVITGQPRHGQRTVPKPADSGGFRALLLLAEQPEGVLPRRAVPDRAAGGQLQLGALLHCRGLEILPQGNSLTDGQHSSLLGMPLGAAAWLFGFSSYLSEKFWNMPAICQTLLLLCRHLSCSTLSLERKDPVTQPSVIR